MLFEVSHKFKNFDRWKKHTIYQVFLRLWQIAVC